MKKSFVISIFKRAGCVLTAVLLCFCISPVSAATDRVQSASFPSLSASSAVLIEAESGRIIGEKNAHERRSMASTTKIMTALVAIENSQMDRVVEIDPRAVGVEGSSVYLYAGERLKMSDLIYALLLESANDAAEAIAIEVGGSIEGFAEMMNKKAEDLGLENTHFDNPHGLDSKNHYTTAYELGKICAEAMKNEVFAEIAATYKKTIPLNETEGVRLLINHNKLLKGYEGCIGVKTGYTKKSGRCLVSAAERDGVRLIAVTLNAPDDWRDHKAMLDYGFSKYEARTLAARGEISIAHPVIGGNESCVILKNTDEVKVVLPKGSPELITKTELFSFSYAPVSEGEILGRTVYYCDGKEIASTPLAASYTVDRIIYKKGLLERLLDLFFK